MKTRMKKIVLVVAMLALAVGSQAQFSMKGGFQGGVVTGPVKIENIDNRFTDVINGDKVYGFEAGVFLKAQVAQIYLKPMALYGFRYGKVTYTPNGESAPQNTNFTMHKVELPVMLGVKFLGPLFAEAGPAYNYIFGITSQFGNNTVNVTHKALGYRVGVGAELGPVLLSVHYSGANYAFSGNRATFREPHKLIFGLGIALGRGIGNNSIKNNNRGNNSNNSNNTRDK